ncbi:uncharacterized protein LOC122063958 isoform X4 [Macadamia integrifolia]|uniref:uncharacterized protein LOC122063958 isoform X4 n=1 Tax=Macadamia integrifolia TaxID=60698 RepID=UPI001C4F15BA|nr:uncharacterized protein LOC122063958 isoform X4 [Macadamia integrifolia]
MLIRWWISSLITIAGIDPENCTAENRLFYVSHPAASRPRKCLASSFTRGLFCCRENKKIKKSCERKSFPGFDMPVSLWTK